MKTIIAIPSYGRFANIVSGKPCTATYVSDTYWENTKYYVEVEELDSYVAAMMRVRKKPEVRTTERVEFAKQWGSIMDLIIDECCQECDHLVIMDDDLRMAYRSGLPKEPTKFEDMTHSLFDSMIEELRGITTMQTPLTSTQYRQFCQGKTETYQYNQRISMIWSLNAKFFRENKLYRFYRHSRLKFMSDYYFFLKLLCAGYQNVCINRFTKDDKPNAPGGEQSKRKMEVFNSAVRRFAGMFPGYVTVREKEGKGNWQDGMLGVTIHAAKALKDAQKKTP